jgi:folate-dependent phosphoribosylglycinamide formyltransferase PurN
MNIVVFAYNFPHKKTQDFLTQMMLFKLKPTLVIASPPLSLRLPPTHLRDKYKHIGLPSPKELCHLLDIEYIEMFHNDESLPHILKSRKIALGIIAGARILKQHIIKSVPEGIINFHPGLIPENRGLNAVKWAIYMNIAQGMTAHLIDEKVDAGRILSKYVTPVYMDDTLCDINLRIYEAQVFLLTKIILHFHEKKAYSIPCKGGDKHPPADLKVDEYIVKHFDEYKKKWSVNDKEYVCICGSRIEKDGEMVKCNICGQQYKKEDEILELRLR